MTVSATTIYMVIFSSVICLSISTNSHRVMSVGIFSICQNATNQSRFNIQASKLNDLYTSLPLKAFQDYTKFNFSHDDEVLNYLSFDVCNDTNRLMEVLITILLHPAFYYNETPFSVPAHRIFLLNAYVNEEMSKLIREVTSLSKIIKLCSPVGCDATKVQDQHSAAYSDYLYGMVDHLQWRNLTLVFIDRFGLSFPYKYYFEKSYMLLKDSKKFYLQKKVFQIPNKDSSTKFIIRKVCPVLKKIASNQTVMIIFQQFRLHFATLWCIERLRQQTFLIVHDLLDSRSNSEHVNWFSINNEFRYDFAYELADLSRLKITERDAIQYGISIQTQRYVFRELNRYRRRKTWDNTGQRQYIDDGISQLVSEGYSYITPLAKTLFLDEQKNLSEKIEESREKLSKKYIHFISNNTLPYTSINCKPGYQKIYGLINDSFDDLFDEKHGWKCQFCPHNHINPNPEISACKPCIGAYNIDDGHRLKCVDPYTDRYHVYTGLQFNVIVLLSSFGSILALVNMGIFFSHRETPTVKVADSMLSVIHIIIVLFSINTTCAVHIIPAYTRGVCIGRNLVLTIFYSLNIGVMFTKSQKLLNAFLATVRLSPHEINRTKAVQIVTITLFVLISNLVLFLSFTKNEPRLHFQLEKEEKSRQHYCNSSQHNSFQIALFIIYQLLCLIQAFRGRHLPGPMNNAMSLIYVTMIITTTFVISFPISYFRNVLDRDFIQCVMVLFNSIVILLFLYGKPCFIIIFKPHKNTREYFIRKRMTAISEQAGVRSDSL